MALTRADIEEAVETGLNRHVLQEETQLKWIWWTLAAGLLIVSVIGAIAGFNLQQTTRNAPTFISEHERTQTILCGWIDSQPGTPPGTIVTLCEGLPKETP